MIGSTPSTCNNLGFLTVLQEATGHLGGYLVTNLWGRPLEFRLSTAVQPNKVQQILYGSSLQNYICADLIGKTLFDKTGTPVQMVITDCISALDLRLRLEMPVICLGSNDGPEMTEAVAVNAGKRTVYHHARFAGDGAALADILQRVDGSLDLAEPFERIRGAIAEARRMGVTGKN